METKKILVVDDEETLCEILQYNLENEGYDVDVAYSAEEALKLKLETYSLIILDIMLGEISGIKLARMIKSNTKTSDVHIMFCSARSSEDDMVMGLEIGADDYITKPYSLRNVLARVKSILRRNHIHEETLPTIAKANVMQVNGLKMDLEFKRCLIDENEVKMTRKEFELLVFLIANRGKICSREEILSKVWKDEVVILDRTIDVNIRRLRSKIGTYGENIVTRCGYGYGFRE
jgi:two-component system phosphate regulon response regulator PhoB